MTVTRNTSRDWAPHYSPSPSPGRLSPPSRPARCLCWLRGSCLECCGRLNNKVYSLHSARQQAGARSLQVSVGGRWRPVWEVGLTCVPAVGGLRVRGRPLSPGGCGGAARGQSAGCAQSAPRHALQPHVGDADDLPGSLHPGHHVGGRRQRT